MCISPLGGLWADERLGQRKGACLKVSRRDFEMANEKSLVLKRSLDFDNLMALEDSSRPSSGEWEDSMETESAAELDLTPLGVDGEIYLMDMTTPGLQSPHLSPQLRTGKMDVDDGEMVFDDGDSNVERVQVASKALFEVLEKSVVTYQMGIKSQTPQRLSTPVPRVLVDGVLAI